MIFKGDKYQLALLLRPHFGAPWWPTRLSWDEATWHSTTSLDTREGEIDYEDVAAIVFATAWVYLVNRGWAPQLFPPVDWRPCYTVRLDRNSHSCFSESGDSPLHALMEAFLKLRAVNVEDMY